MLWRSGGYNCRENYIRSSKIHNINLLFLQSMWALWFSIPSLYTRLQCHGYAKHIHKMHWKFWEVNSVVLGVYGHI